MPTLTEHAPAKLNLALSVGPPEGPGGMHPISSWMVNINLVDELRLTRLDDGDLSRYAILWHREAPRRSEIDWSITRDLAVRAHLALERHMQASLPVKMRLDKRIPVGGGLGGGSSDAAAMLRGLNRLFDLGCSVEELAKIGATIGSDVPFLVHGGSAIVTGTGERIAPQATAPTLHAVLVFPESTCPTAAVYSRFDELGGAALRHGAVEDLAAAGPEIPPVAPLFNDLTAAALHVAPELQPLLRDLAALAGRPAHLSGSGSTIFVLCESAAYARSLAADAARAFGVPALPTSTWRRPSTQPDERAVA